MSRNKYKNTKVILDGITFDSKREATRYKQLKELERIGVIEGLELQKKFELIPSQYEEYTVQLKTKTKTCKRIVERPCVYYADFYYIMGGSPVVEDTKSRATITDKYIIKRKLMRYLYGIAIKEV